MRTGSREEEMGTGGFLKRERLLLLTVSYSRLLSFGAKTTM